MDFKGFSPFSLDFPSCTFHHWQDDDEDTAADEGMHGQSHFQLEAVETKVAETDSRQFCLKKLVMTCWSFNHDCTGSVFPSVATGCLNGNLLITI